MMDYLRDGALGSAGPPVPIHVNPSVSDGAVYVTFSAPIDPASVDGAGVSHWTITDPQGTGPFAADSIQLTDAAVIQAALISGSFNPGDTVTVAYDGAAGLGGIGGKLVRAFTARGIAS